MIVEKRMSFEDIINELKSYANPEAVKGMARFGVGGSHTLGVSIPTLRVMAKRIGKNHIFAQKLWATGVHEARILASMVEDRSQVTEEQMEKWVSDFDSWDVTDQAVMNLLEKLPQAWEKAVIWCKEEAEFVKRTGFVLMARLAVSDKKAADEKFLYFFPYILKEAEDERNFVKKAVNWAIRQIGKRNRNLNTRAIALSEEILLHDSSSARWIARDALKELRSEAVQNRLKS
jgi:3-methyladenine DNA glycosylase AlkD